MSSIVLSTHVWQQREGLRVTRRRRYETLAGAARFARRASSDDDVVRVTITDDTEVDGQLNELGSPAIGPSIATFENGVCVKTTNPALDEGNDPNGDTTMSKNDTTTDAGTDVKRGRAAAKPAKADRAIVDPKTKRSKKAHTVPDVLAMTDGAVLKLDPAMRCDLAAAVEHDAVAKVLAKYPYAVSYVRFLHGERKHFPQARMANLPADEAKSIRDAVRVALAKACGLKKLPTAERAARPKAEAKPAAKPAPKRAAAAKRTTTSTRAKRTTAKKG